MPRMSDAGVDAPGAASLLVVGFDGLEATDALLALVEEERVAGVILFRRNIRDAEQVAGLVAALRRDRPDLLVSIDEEGGRVRRLSADFTTFPSMDLVGRTGSRELAAELGAAIARELRAIGVNWDFAPVLDVHTRAENPVIGPRSLSPDPGTVASLGCAFLHALQEGRVAACAKHFPGHGDTDLDSHHALPTVERSADGLRDRELVPFRAAVEAGVATVMTAHVVYPALDPDRPATLSPRILGDLLRGELGFEGVIVTDDLEMRAVADDLAPEELGLVSLEAGADLLLACEKPEVQRRILRGLEDGLGSGRLPAERLARSADRVRALARRFAGPAPDPAEAVETAGAGRELVQRIESAARA